jgi:hypothetical protein
MKKFKKILGRTACKFPKIRRLSLKRRGRNEVAFAAALEVLG